MDIALVSVTAISLTMAFAMGVVAWRVIREERRRSDARVAALLTELDHTRDGTGGGAATRPRSRGSAPPASRVPAVPNPPSVPRSPELLTVAPEPSVSRRPLLATVAAVGVVLVVATIAMRSGREASPPVASGPATPVELLSLAHARQGEYLAISGALRNPTDGVDRGRLSVMATVFDRDGTLIGTGQTPLPVRALAPGSETPFTISMPDADRISRYRISFAQDQTSVPHIDRRRTPDAGETAATAGRVQP